MAAESLLEKKLVRYAKSRGVWTRKFTSPGHVSVPDRVFMTRGYTLFLEIKAVGKRPTEGQMEEIKLISLQGGLATWVDNFEDGKAFIDLLKEAISFETLFGRCFTKNRQ